MGRFIDLTNRTFNRLKVIKRWKSIKNKIIWECLCKCGVTLFVPGHDVKSGHTKSCGCLQREFIIKQNYRHGQIKHPLYTVWQGMKMRCNRKNFAQYKNYGGRGIKVCTVWNNNFQCFLNDMRASYKEHIKKYGKVQTTIERINNDEGYSKDNCCWATRSEQKLNCRPRKTLKQRGIWSLARDRCKHCKTIEVPHLAKGFCKKCYYQPTKS